MNKNYKRGRLPSFEYVNNAVDSEYFILVNSAGYIDNESESSDGTGKGYLLLYLEQGELSATLRDEEHILCSGQAIIFSPDTFYKIKNTFGNGSSIYYFVSFTGRFAGTVLNSCSIATEAVMDIGTGNGFTDNFERLFRDFEEFSENRDIALFDFLAPSHLLKTIADLKKASNRVVHKYLSSNRIQKSVEYIKRHYSLPLTVEEIAAKHHFSPSYFRKLFKESTGLSPLEYVTDLRIGHACQMLLGGTALVEEVAQRCGFMSISYFGKVFRKSTGLSPTQYRKINRKANM